MTDSVRGAFAFGRERRVRKRSEFAHVQASSRRVTTPHFVLLVAARRAGGPAGPSRPGSPAGPSSPGSPAGPSRLGLIVTRKVGGAVARNRVKRVCRECFRLWPGLLPDGVDLVVIARLGADSLGRQDVRAEWAGVSGLLRKRAEEALARAGAMPHVSGGQK